MLYGRGLFVLVFVIGHLAVTRVQISNGRLTPFYFISNLYVIMEQNYYKYENEIGFNIDVIKTALKEILSKNKTRFIHKEEDLNDTFGTYHFGETKCSYMLTLKKIDDNTTNITINCSSRSGGFNPSMASLEGYTNEFLKILTAKLNGASDEEMKVVVKENDSDSSLSSFSAIITLIIVVAALYLMFFT